MYIKVECMSNGGRICMSSKDLAEKILNYELAYRRNPEVKATGVLSNSITIQLSNDAMMWYLWMSSSDQTEKFFKAVPALQYNYESIYNMLQSQRWVCI